MPKQRSQGRLAMRLDEVNTLDRLQEANNKKDSRLLCPGHEGGKISVWSCHVTEHPASPTVLGCVDSIGVGRIGSYLSVELFCIHNYEKWKKKHPVWRRWRTHRICPYSDAYTTALRTAKCSRPSWCWQFLMAVGHHLRKQLWGLQELEKEFTVFTIPILITRLLRH